MSLSWFQLWIKIIFLWQSNNVQCFNRWSGWIISLPHFVLEQNFDDEKVEQKKTHTYKRQLHFSNAFPSVFEVCILFGVCVWLSIEHFLFIEIIKWDGLSEKLPTFNVSLHKYLKLSLLNVIHSPSTVSFQRTLNYAIVLWVKHFGTLENGNGVFSFSLIRNIAMFGLIWLEINVFELSNLYCNM